MRDYRLFSGKWNKKLFEAWNYDMKHSFHLQREKKVKVFPQAYAALLAVRILVVYIMMYNQDEISGGHNTNAALPPTKLPT